MAEGTPLVIHSHPSMLYSAWQKIVHSSHHEAAIFTAPFAPPLTFGQLDSRLQRRPPSRSRSPLFSNPAGRPIDFLVDILLAWRDDRPFIPLDSPLTPQLKKSLSSLPDQAAHVKITSGSSGVPRPIAFSADQLVADASQITTTMGLSPESTNVAVISLAHSYGFSNLVLTLLLHGIPLALAASPLPETMRISLATHRACTLPAVPAMWRAWHLANVFSHHPPRLAISAGAPLDPILEGQIFSNSGLKIHNFYGASECGGIAYDRTLLPRDPACPPAGTPMDGVSLAVDGSGRLLITSPATAIAYVDNLDVPTSPSSSTIIGNTFQSADLARVENGQLFLTGRVTDVINLAGRKLDPSVVENCLSHLDGIRHCLVFGIPSTDPTRSEETVACVYPERNFDLQLTKAEISSALPSWQLPRHWWITNELVPDLRGKLSRHHWRERFLASRPANDATT
jgi:long-chain acyl-CoA synthetase